VDYKKYIEANPKILLGKPVIKGTRIPVELILRKLAEGYTLEELKEAYPGIKNEALKSIFLYASEVLSHEEVVGA